MNTRIFGLLLALAAFFVVGAVAADVTGKWTAEMERNGQTFTQTFDLKASGDTLTGTVGSQMGQREISEGKVNGDQISFVVKFERNGNEIKMNYTGTVSGNEIKFKVESPRGTREMTAKRAVS